MLKNKWKWIVSSVLILLPMLLGLIVWDKLPESMPIHWGVDGKADGFGTPLTVVIFMPLLLLVLHWFGLWFTAKDNEKNNQSGKVTGMVYWILPLISLLVCGVIYTAAFDYAMGTGTYVALLLGVMFLIIGNYMPKCRPNRTIGIKIKWTLANEENWERTHRLSGKVWVIAGVLCLPAALLPMKVFPFVMLPLLLVCVIVPLVYSYSLYRKHLRDGVATKEEYKAPLTKVEKTVLWILMPVVLALLVFSVVSCFTGDIAVQLGEDSFTIEASYYEDLHLSYADIDSVEYRTADDPGERVSGFGTPRLLMGWFRNEEFGNYTRYSYASADTVVVIRLDGKTLVIGLEDAAETETLYESLMEKVGG